MNELTRTAPVGKRGGGGGGGGGAAVPPPSRLRRTKIYRLRVAPYLKVPITQLYEQMSTKRWSTTGQVRSGPLLW